MEGRGIRESKGEKQRQGREKREKDDGFNHQILEFRLPKRNSKCVEKKKNPTQITFLIFIYFQDHYCYEVQESITNVTDNPFYLDPCQKDFQTKGKWEKNANDFKVSFKSRVNVGINLTKIFEGLITTNPKMLDKMVESFKMSLSGGVCLCLQFFLFFFIEESLYLLGFCFQCLLLFYIFSCIYLLVLFCDFDSFF